MLNSPTESQCGILYIDDEEKALKYFRMAFSEKFKVFTATSGHEGLQILEREQMSIGIVISDQRMPEMLGAEFLGAVRERFPRVVRILTTAYSDLDSAIQAVNKGHIYQYVVKPWEIADLEMVLHRAADYFHVLSERDELLSLKMTTVQRIVAGDRLKWLLLSTATLDEASKKAFGQALSSLIEALPQEVERLSPTAGRFRKQDFDTASLLRQEYDNATRCLGALANLSSATVEAEVAAFISALSLPANAASLSGDTLTINAEITPSDLLKAVFGLLIAREPSDASIHFFGILFAVAKAGGSLRVAAGPAAYDFALANGASGSAQDAIDGLTGKFSSWDISLL